MIVKEDEILGYSIDDNLTCQEYLTKEEAAEITADDIVFDHPKSGVKRDEEMGFYDRCKKRLW